MGEQEPVFSVERMRGASAIVVVINDEPYDVDCWKRFLPTVHPGYYCIGLTNNDEIKTFIRSFPFESQLTIQMVLADQFCVGSQETIEMRSSTDTALSQIREYNPDCWIIETSNAPGRSVYTDAKSNSIIFMDDMHFFKTELARQSKLFRTANLSYIVSQSMNDAFMYASLVEDEDIAPEEYYLRLWKHGQFFDLLAMLGIEQSEFERAYDGVGLDTQRAIVHEAFRVLGHLSARRGDEFYGLAFQRLRQTLGLLPDSEK